MTISEKKIAIIGLGYVGLPLAVEFGKSRGVVGFDINPHRIAELRGGHDATLEVDSNGLAAAKHLRFSADLSDLARCSIFIVTVPTPMDTANRPDMTPLIKASQTVGKVLKPGDIVIYESHVYSGATEEVCVPMLKKHDGLKLNQHRQEHLERQRPANLRRNQFLVRSQNRCGHLAHQLQQRG